MGAYAWPRSSWQGHHTTPKVSRSLPGAPSVQSPRFKSPDETLLTSTEIVSPLLTLRMSISVSSTEKVSAGGGAGGGGDGGGGDEGGELAESPPPPPPQATKIVAATVIRTALPGRIIALLDSMDTR